MRLAAALLIAAALLAGCGDEGDTTVINTTVVEDSTDDGTTTATTTTGEVEAEDDDDDTVEPDDDGATVALDAFQTPTENIACVMSAKFVRCDIAEKSWTAPRPPGCPGASDFGQGLTMDADGPAEVVCAGDTVLNPQAPVLDYGETSQIGSIRCESDESGVECANDAGGEFSLSREEYELN